MLFFFQILFGFSLILVFLLCVVFFFNLKNMVNLMILSEFFILSLIFFFILKNTLNFLVILVLLLVGVCEAALGLSFVVCLIRKNVVKMKSFL